MLLSLGPGNVLGDPLVLRKIPSVVGLSFSTFSMPIILPDATPSSVQVIKLSKLGFHTLPLAAGLKLGKQTSPLPAGSCWVLLMASTEGTPETGGGREDLFLPVGISLAMALHPSSNSGSHLPTSSSMTRNNLTASAESTSQQPHLLNFVSQAPRVTNAFCVTTF